MNFLLDRICSLMRNIQGMEICGGVKVQFSICLIRRLK